MFKDEIKSLQSLRGKLLQRVQELEDELKTARDEAEKLARSNKSDDEVSSLIFRVTHLKRTSIVSNGGPCCN